MAQNLLEDGYRSSKTRYDIGDRNLCLLEVHTETSSSSDVASLDPTSDGLDYKITERGLGVSSMLRLTCGVFGLQLVWSVLMSSGTSYLQTVGLSKPLTSLALVSGPLAGAIVQPVVGAYSDRCEHPWGRRRPYMVGGAFCCILSMLSLAWIKDSTHFLAVVFNINSSSDVLETATIFGAVFWVCILNTSLQPLQAGVRAFIIDNCPQHQQVEANAWAGRLTGFGNTIGYTMGMAQLPRLLPFLGNTEFKVQCALASIALTITLAICCLSIHEEVPVQGKTDGSCLNITAIFLQLYRSIKTLPPLTRQVCKVQFFAWMGWFPFLFYITSYIGELYSRPILMRVTSLPNSKELQEVLWDKASRVGTSGSFSFALVSLSMSLVAPFFVQPITHHSVERKFAASRFGLKKVALPKLWKLSHIFFSFCMLLTIFAQSEFSGRIFIGMAGLSWALTSWAPFALISSEISRMKSDQRRMAVEEELDSRMEIKAGVVIGLHNVAIASPQILSALLCSLILRLLQAFGLEDGFGWLLRMAGIPALIAAYLMRDL